MRCVLSPGVDFAMVEGYDGSQHKHLLAGGQGDTGQEVPPEELEACVQAVEAAMGCRFYRGWPICETTDVLRALVEGGEGLEGEEDAAGKALRLSELSKNLSDADAWERYRRWFADWPRYRAMAYMDFHCRHLTLGEAGAALSHLQVIEEAQHAAVPWQIIFEDDARPLPQAVPRLAEEIELLEQHGFAWDLIYLRSSLYSRQPEEALAPLVPGSRLFWARHRKVTDAYCLSRRGLARVAACGLRESLFAFDDFLPSLHSSHPRLDVMRLRCVASGRVGSQGGFVGLSFGTEVLSEVARSGSETNFSPCILGDHGAELG